MGMDADIIAIGPFKQGLAEYYDYPRAFYAHTQEGTEVVLILAECQTTRCSRELARALGIDPWDFNQHKLDLAKVDRRAMSDVVGAEEVRRFDVLAKAGFVFFYRPNG